MTLHTKPGLMCFNCFRVHTKPGLMCFNCFHDILPRAVRALTMQSPPGTSGGNRFRKSRKHDGPTPSQTKKQRQAKVQVQQNIHQASDPARNFVKGAPTGNHVVLVSLTSEEDFAQIEAAINSSRLGEELKLLPTPITCLRSHASAQS